VLTDGLIKSHLDAHQSHGFLFAHELAHEVPIGTVYSTIIFPIYCSNKAILGSKNLKTIDDGWVNPFVYGWAHQIPTDSPVTG